MFVTITRRYIPVSLKVRLSHFNFLDNFDWDFSDYDIAGIFNINSLNPP